MTRREKVKALRLLAEAEKIWRNSTWQEAGGWKSKQCCNFCRAAKGGCMNCLVWKVIGEDCFNTMDKADRTHNRRPVYDLIRKIRKELEK